MTICFHKGHLEMAPRWSPENSWLLPGVFPLIDNVNFICNRDISCHNNGLPSWEEKITWIITWPSVSSPTEISKCYDGWISLKCCGHCLGKRNGPDFFPWILGKVEIGMLTSGPGAQHQRWKEIIQSRVYNPKHEARDYMPYAKNTILGLLPLVNPGIPRESHNKDRVRGCTRHET